MLHMILGLFLALAVQTAFASDKNVTIRISSAENVRLTDKERLITYIADNSACVEMSSRHGIPYLAAKEKRKQTEITKDTISFKKISSGICDYQFANLYFSFKLNNKMIATNIIYHSDEAGDEVKLICKIPKEDTIYLSCRSEDGEYGMGYGLKLNMKSKNEKTVEIILE